jgi:hypothetical protein
MTNLQNTNKHMNLTNLEKYGNYTKQMNLTNLSTLRNLNKQVNLTNMKNMQTSKTNESDKFEKSGKKTNK